MKIYSKILILVPLTTSIYYYLNSSYLPTKKTTLELAKVSRESDLESKLPPAPKRSSPERILINHEEHTVIFPSFPDPNSYFEQNSTKN
ncbi:MAG: hypothetical protein Q7S27_03705 [Nanoarchaeota archaeon]|nr:hypothetical protein [Nanoarchaeota archaeon]